MSAIDRDQADDLAFSNRFVPSGDHFRLADIANQKQEIMPI